VAEVAAAGTSGGGGARTSGRGGVNPAGLTKAGVGGGAERRSISGGAGRESAGRGKLCRTATRCLWKPPMLGCWLQAMSIVVYSSDGLKNKMMWLNLLPENESHFSI
jgi:hypothetical protein